MVFDKYKRSKISFYRLRQGCFEREVVAAGRPHSISESIVRCSEWSKSLDNVGSEGHYSVVSFTLRICLASSVSWYCGWSASYGTVSLISPELATFIEEPVKKAGRLEKIWIPSSSPTQTNYTSCQTVWRYNGRILNVSREFQKYLILFRSVWEGSLLSQVSLSRILSLVSCTQHQYFMWFSSWSLSYVFSK